MNFEIFIPTKNNHACGYQTTSNKGGSMNLNGTELMNCQNSSMSAGNYTLGNISALGNTCCDTFYHYYPTWYPTYHICEKSKIEQAFKIIGKLMEGKIIEKDLTVKQFMKLVNDIAEVL